MSTEQSASSRGRWRKRAGVFDIRSVIGLLLGIYGVILLGMGLFGTSAEDLAKTDGTNVNTWTGIALLVAAAALFTWARLRPILVPATSGDGDADTTDDRTGH